MSEAEPKPRGDGRERNKVASWRPRTHFVAILAGACVLAVVLFPWWGRGAIWVPFAIFTCMFILPDLLFPDRVKIEFDEDGIRYADFSQSICAPWSRVVGLEQHPGVNRFDVKVDYPLSNFSVRLSHPMAKALLERVEKHLHPQTAAG